MSMYKVTRNTLIAMIVITMHCSLWAMEAVREQEAGQSLADVVNWTVPGKITERTGLNIGFANQGLRDIQGINRLWVNTETGPMPISGLKSFRLYLNGNRLKNLPKEIGKLTNMEALYVDDNRLELLPPEIGDLTGLRYLLASNNNLQELPKRNGKS